MRWWIGLALAAAVTAGLYAVGATYPVLYVARQIIFHLVGH